MLKFTKTGTKKQFEEFNKKYESLQLSLYKTLIEDKARLNTRFSDADYGIFVTQAMAHLLGESGYFFEKAEQSSDPMTKHILELYPLIQSEAERIYKIWDIQVNVTAILDYKYIRLHKLLGDKWDNGDEAAIIAERLTSVPKALRESEDYKQTMYQMMLNLNAMK